ncbi:translation initiation factor IF-2-like [Choloepus didactylus]|uniref:translation initiation factor IF-2-like n=1 Tax=Choloepus didactylus TaxID=27675 RepID=UPI00189D7BEE|nr:translation initiation factor IF-2-like [Choloepus didactylus]
MKGPPFIFPALSRAVQKARARVVGGCRSAARTDPHPRGSSGGRAGLPASGQSRGAGVGPPSTRPGVRAGPGETRPGSARSPPGIHPPRQGARRPLRAHRPRGAPDHVG